jgi:hypothetical protein
MATVKIDIIEKSRIREEDGLVVEAWRTAIVSGITGIPDGAPFGRSQKIYPTALGTSGVPQPGDEHPTYKGLTVRRREPNTLSSSIVQIDIVYLPPPGLGYPETPPGTASIPSGRGSVDQREIFRDGAGLPLQVMHADDTQDGSINVLVPRFEKSFVQVTTSSFPDYVAAFVGKVNQTPFPGPSPAFIRKYMLIDAPYELVGDVTSDPPTYRFTFLFRYDAEGHDPFIFYRDRETRLPATGLVPGVGFKQITYYEETDFANGLQLP